METSKIYSIGQLVQWVTGKNVKCEGIVRDDLGKDTVIVVCTSINGKKSNTQVKVKRELLLIIKKSDKVMATDVKKTLLLGKYKKYSKNQLLDKFHKLEEGLEKDIILELLNDRGVTSEELGIAPEVSKTETGTENQPENEEQEGEKLPEPKKEESADQNEENVEESVKLPEPDGKIVSKKIGKRHIVEIEPENEDTPESKKIAKNSTTSKEKVSPFVNKEKNQFGHIVGSKGSQVDEVFIKAKKPLTIKDIQALLPELKIEKIKDHVHHLLNEKKVLEKVGNDSYKLIK